MFEKFIRRHEDGSEEYEVSIISHQTREVLFTTDVRMQPSVARHNVFDWQLRLGKAFVAACNQRVNLTSALLDGIELNDFEVPEHVDLSQASFRNAKLTKVKFNKATLYHADFTKAQIDYCHFVRCSMIGVRFNETNITGCHFEKTVLTCCRLFCSVVDRSGFIECDFDEMQVFDTTYVVRGIDHLNRS